MGIGSQVSSAVGAAGRAGSAVPPQRLAQLAAKARESAASLKPPPVPPPPPAIPAPGKGVPASGLTPHQERYKELMRRVEAAEPAPEGHTRLYRVGEVATNFQPPKTVKQWGKDIPYDEWRAWRDTEMKRAGGLDPNPHGAAGRWATDAPHELDFYVGENDLTAPIYHFDVPSHEVPQHNVRNTPFLENSRNPDREFVLPTEHLKKAVRIMSLPTAVGVGAAASGQQGLLDGLRENR